MSREEEEDRGTSLRETPSSSDGTRSFASDHNDFALALYGQVRQQPGNIFFSPFSIRAALGMAYAGARGKTASQMSKALCFVGPSENVHIAFAEVIQRLNTAGGSEYEMSVANSLWGQDGEPLQPEFLDLVSRHYHGEMRLADFHRGANAARVAINRWVEDKTKQKIRDVIPEGSLNADTRLVLVNAVYFKGMWLLKFSKSATRDEPFYLDDGGTVQTPLMYQMHEVRYLQGRGYQAVDLDYQGGALSMLVLLPDKRDGLRDLETGLSVRMLHDCVTRMSEEEVKIFLPKLKVTWGTTDLGPVLSALGMPLAFTPAQADFSGINGQEPPKEESLFLSSVFHKAFVDVNEVGTEAAAATAVAMRLAGLPQTPPPVPIFRADHPFLFAIRDRKSGAFLFIGRVADPTRGN